MADGKGTPSAVPAEAGVLDEQEGEVLMLDRLVSGDRPSTVMVGMLAAQSLLKSGCAVFLVDALGRVRIMPPTSIQVTHPPRLRESDLDPLDETQAIQLLEMEGADEVAIAAYLQGRDARAAARSG